MITINYRGRARKHRTHHEYGETKKIYSKYTQYVTYETPCVFPGCDHVNVTYHTPTSLKKKRRKRITLR